MSPASATALAQGLGAFLPASTSGTRASSGLTSPSAMALAPRARMPGVSSCSFGAPSGPCRRIGPRSATRLVARVRGTRVRSSVSCRRLIWPLPATLLTAVSSAR